MSPKRLSVLNAIRFLSSTIFLEKKWLTIGLILTSLLSTLVWVGPRLMGYIIDDGVLLKNRSIVIWGAVGLMGVELLRLLSVYLSQWCYSVLGQNVIERIRVQLIQHLMKLPIPYFDQVSSGKMMTRVVNDTNSLSDLFQSGFVSVLGNIANITAIFIGLMSLNFKLGMILFMLFIPIVLVCMKFSVKLRIAYENARNQLSQFNAILADFLFGMRTIKSLSLVPSKKK
jgi:ABC-type multidrug transport system fused ATPase/permease subunit